MENVNLQASYTGRLVFKGHGSDIAAKVATVQFAHEIVDAQGNVLAEKERVIAYLHDAQVAVRIVPTADRRSPRERQEAKQKEYAVQGSYSAFTHTMQECEAVRDSYVLPFLQES